MDLEDNEGAIENLKNINPGSGPASFIIKKNLDFQTAQAYINSLTTLNTLTSPNQTCPKIKSLLDSLGDQTPVLIFSQTPYQIQELNKSWAFYYLVCEKNQNLAQRYLSSYLGQPNITPLEKTKTEGEFFNLVQNID